MERITDHGKTKLLEIRAGVYQEHRLLAFVCSA